MKQFILIITFILLPFFSKAQQDTTQLSLPPDVEKLYNFVKQWWKTPYRYGGTSSKGIDCSAFTNKLFKNVYNIVLPRTAYQQYKVSKRIKKEELQNGDLVFFRTKYKSGWHVGVYLIDGYFVHSGSGKGVIISHLEDKYYKLHYYGAGRLL
jgi:lipoprotein Spr